ncbi:MAG: glucosaminidase domain-containing protein, partial [Lachnospiraceae bacterium]|nr:glucosaminidase domain-containing protein [Lachnospiraceae bacterium]
MTQQEFINKLAPIAVRDMRDSGVPASVTIAQGILESGYGTEELAVKANNFFGMKCTLSGNTWKSVWDGKTKHTKKTKEQTKDGREYTVMAAFRKYPDMETSVKDHSCYLTGAKNGPKLRFAGLSGEKDPKKAIKIIKDGGYATDVKYVDKVMSIINKYNLTQYDKAAGSDVSGQKPCVQIISKPATKNNCYKNSKKIIPKGIMLHSVGCPQPDPNVFVKNWQSSGAF